MALNPGALNDAGEYVDPENMARYIEEALPTPGPPPADPADPVYMRTEKRKFLIGLATGIVNYLKAHDADSFVVHISPEGAGVTAELEIT